MNELLYLLTARPAPIPPGISNVARIHSSGVRGDMAEDVDDMFSCGSCGKECGEKDMHVRKNGNIGSQCHHCFELQQARRLRQRAMVEQSA